MKGSIWERLCKVGEELTEDGLPLEEKEFLMQRVEALIDECKKEDGSMVPTGNIRADKKIARDLYEKGEYRQVIVFVDSIYGFGEGELDRPMTQSHAELCLMQLESIGESDDDTVDGLVTPIRRNGQ